MLLEGMMLGAYAMQATDGLIYCRAEYPLAVERLKKAIAAARIGRTSGKKHSGNRFQPLI